MTCLQVSSFCTGILAVAMALTTAIPITACRSSESETSGAPSAEPALSAIPGPPDDGQVRIDDLVEGDGDVAHNGDTAKVLGVSKFLDGREFDSAARHGGAPYAFTIGAGRAVKGLDRGIVGMRVHGKRRLTVPPSLGYGERGVRGIVPPRSWLVFEFELVELQRDATAGVLSDASDPPSDAGLRRRGARP